MISDHLALCLFKVKSRIWNICLVYNNVAKLLEMKAAKIYNIMQILYMLCN